MGLITKPNVKTSIRGNYQIRKVTRDIYEVFSKAFSTRTDDSDKRVLMTQNLKLTLTKKQISENNIFKLLYDQVRKLNDMTHHSSIDDPLHIKEDCDLCDIHEQNVKRLSQINDIHLKTISVCRNTIHEQQGIYDNQIAKLEIENKTLKIQSLTKDQILQLNPKKKEKEPISIVGGLPTKKPSKNILPEKNVKPMRNYLKKKREK